MKQQTIKSSPSHVLPKPLVPESNRKIMLFTKQIETAPRGGRQMLCKFNHDVLTSIYGENLIVFELRYTSPRSSREILNTFNGQIDGICTQTTDEAIQIIQRENVCQVFVDGSNFGGFVAVLKNRLKHIEVLTFFHNVEARFFWGSFATTKTPHALGVFIANFLAERKAVRFSNKRICLSQRDSRLLNKLYGKGATHIAPMALIDQLPFNLREQTFCENESFILFVGGSFYANREGIRWFVKNVATRIDIKICIVGNGMENLKEEFRNLGRVEVIGKVENLAEWYKRSLVVIAPIFDGSGMKTKVAEALMHGKRIIGTPESFSGYEDIIDKVGWLCESPDDFVEAIAEAKLKIKKIFDQELRNIYEKQYSIAAGTERLRTILFAA